MYGGGPKGNIARDWGESAYVTLLHPTSPDIKLMTLLSMTFTARAKRRKARKLPTSTKAQVIRKFIRISAKLNIRR